MKLLAFVDKKYSDHHPFVDEVLCKYSLDLFDEVICFFVKEKNNNICNGKTAEIRSILPERSLIGRMISINFVAILIILEAVKSKEVRIFVRNEPSYLLGATISRYILAIFGVKIDMIFQSSFPHESASGNSLMRLFAVMIHRLCVREVKSIIAVSYIGLKRLSGYLPNNNTVVKTSIPLLCEDEWLFDSDYVSEAIRSKDFVYIGDTSSRRSLNDIIILFEEVCGELGLDNQLHIFGNKSDESIQKLCNSLSASRVVLHEKISRAEIKSVLCKFTFGFCLIPPLSEFIESSPTKLGEYMSRGVIPIVNEEIPSLLQCYEENPSIVLTKYSHSEIKSSIKLALTMSDDEIYERRTRIIEYAAACYSYKSSKERLNSALKFK